MPTYRVAGRIRYIVTKWVDCEMEARNADEAMSNVVDDEMPTEGNEATWDDDTLTVTLAEEPPEQPEYVKMRALGVPSLFD